jgi:chromosome segregation ATPase
MKTRGFKSNISQMSDKEKTEWILNAMDEIEKSDDKLKVLNRKIMKLHKENKELKQENQHLTAQLASNQPEMQADDDVYHIEEDDLHTPSPPPPHLSPVNTADVIKSVKRRMGWKKTPSHRTPRNMNLDGGKKNKFQKKIRITNTRKKSHRRSHHYDE